MLNDLKYVQAYTKLMRKENGRVNTPCYEIFQCQTQNQQRVTKKNTYFCDWVKVYMCYT